jgi:hypothetical protein
MNAQRLRAVCLGDGLRGLAVGEFQIEDGV